MCYSVCSKLLWRFICLVINVINKQLLNYYLKLCRLIQIFDCFNAMSKSKVSNASNLVNGTKLLRHCIPQYVAMLLVTFIELMQNRHYVDEIHWYWSVRHTMTAVHNSTELWATRVWHPWKSHCVVVEEIVMVLDHSVIIAPIQSLHIVHKFLIATCHQFSLPICLQCVILMQEPTN